MRQAIRLRRIDSMLADGLIRRNLPSIVVVVAVVPPAVRLLKL